MRDVSRALPKLSVREGGEREEGREPRAGREDGEEMGSSLRRTWTYASWDGLVLYRPPSLPQESEREKNRRSTRGLREKGAADCDPRILRLQFAP
jgi:hypothetical protein